MQTERMRILLVLLSAGSLLLSCSEAATPCVIEWAGAIEGTGECKGAPDVLLGAGASPSSLNWAVSAESDTHVAMLSFDVENPPEARTYTGIDAATPRCFASVQLLDNGELHTARSQTSASSAAPVGSCAITFTEAAESGSNASVKYTVHGSAEATLVSTVDETSTVTLTVTF